MMRLSHSLLLVSVFAFACSGPSHKNRQEAQAFLDVYNKEYKALYTAASNGQWQVNTHIVEGDTMNAFRSRQAEEAMARFTGSEQNILQARKFLAMEKDLSPIQVKQLKKVLYLAAGNPATDSMTVKALIAAGTAQTERLYGFKFSMDGKEVTPNEIDSMLNDVKDTLVRRKAWEASKAVGADLKEGLVRLRELRNKVVKGLGYSDYFSYQVSDYGMSSEQMMRLLDKFNQELYPLYRELHTYVRYQLAAQYGVKEVPEYIPAHWLSNRWGQDWSNLVTVEGLNLDSALQSKNAEWIARQGEKFYVSLGFPALPATFWEKSSLYPVDKDAGFKKNTHASAWHMDLENDLRSLMSITPNAEWYETVHHEYGHIYYYSSYSNPQVPYLLREGANRAYHEALGSMMGLAAMQRPFVAGLGLIDTSVSLDATRQLLKEALNYVVFIPWSAGTMSHFEYELYANDLPPEKWNQTWWDIVRKYQGIVPPSTRNEQMCDPATKTHINDDAAQYYDYALSFILLFQLHDHISKQILHQDPRATNYFGNKEVGAFIGEIMRPGSSADWRQLLKDKTGEDLSARAMLEYFEPLMAWLKEQNKGRRYTLPAR